MVTGSWECTSWALNREAKYISLSVIWNHLNSWTSHGSENSEIEFLIKFYIDRDPTCTCKYMHSMHTSGVALVWVIQIWAAGEIKHGGTSPEQRRQQTSEEYLPSCRPLLTAERSPQVSAAEICAAIKTKVPKQFFKILICNKDWAAEFLYIPHSTI